MASDRTDIWLINGIPGAGKSTTARELAARFARSAHIEGDRLQELIVSGAVWPGGEPEDEERRQIHLNVRNQCLLARSFAEDDFTPVLDYVVVDHARVDEYRRLLAGYTLHLVTLAPGVDIALERDRWRSAKTVAAGWIHLDEIIREELKDIGLLVDNADLTVSETVDYILEHQADAVV